MSRGRLSEETEEEDGGERDREDLKKRGVVEQDVLLLVDDEGVRSDELSDDVVWEKACFRCDDQFQERSDFNEMKKNHFKPRWLGCGDIITLPRGICTSYQQGMGSVPNRSSRTTTASGCAIQPM